MTPKILQIFHRYLEYGGEEGSVKRIREALQEISEVEIYQSSSEEYLASPPINKLKSAFVAYHNPKTLSELKNFQARKRFDVWQIHNVFPFMSPSVYEYAFANEIPVVQYLHNYRMSCTNGYFLNHGSTCTSCITGNFTKAVLTGCWHDSRVISTWMATILLRIREIGTFSKVAAWIALSNSQKALHIQMGIPEERIHIVPHFYEVADSRKNSSEGNDVLFVGRLSKEKGVHQLLDAWKLIPGSSRSLLIMGDGPELENLKERVRVEKIGKVNFLGFVAQKDQAEIWNRSAFAVVPSIWQDPLPTVVFEAWERGRTVIVSAAGGLDDSVIHGVDGLKFEMGNSAQLAQAIGDLLEDPLRCRHLAASGLEKLKNSFSKTDWLARIGDIYGKIGCSGNAAIKTREFSDVGKKTGVNPQQILAVVQMPPPYHGQAIMNQVFVTGQYQQISVHVVRMAFSDSLEDVGRVRWGKIFEIFRLLVLIPFHRWRTGASILYYPPASPNLVPVIRDIVILGLTRCLFRKTVFHFHAGGIGLFVENLPFPLGGLARMAYGKADLGIVLGKFAEIDARCVGCKQTEVVKYGIADHYAQADPHRDVNKIPVILFVGMVCKQKGVGILLEALAQLFSQGTKFLCVIAGSPASKEELDDLRQQSVNLGICERVDFCGVIEGDKKRLAYMESDIFCFPTMYESEALPVVILEAMMFGKPVISSAWRGIPEEVIDGETGFLVSLGDSITVADRLRLLINDSELRQRMGDAGRRHYLANFTVDQFRSQMESRIVCTGAAVSS